MKVIEDVRGETISVVTISNTIQIGLYDESVELDEDGVNNLITALQTAKEELE
ncbi:MAG: hypothetical protein Q8S00_32570 [Deltaproteobacteria bacterium]|nr:hypothetical protein [Deltaproteobacteria bacterium]